MENFSAWMRGAERLLETLPGVRSASLEGDLEGATEVRLVVEEGPPVSETLEAARVALEEESGMRPLGAFFRIQVTSVGDEAPYLQSQIHENPAAAALDTPGRGRIRLISHQTREVSPGVVGVDLTLGFVARRFAGGASGQADSAGRYRVPALATLSALGSYIRFASKGADGPTLALESVSQFSLGGTRVAVVVLTMSDHGAPLIASWPLTGAAGPAVVRATLEAAARRVTQLSMVEDRPPSEAKEPVESADIAGSGGILRQQAESLLESAKTIASARIVLDDVQGFRIHILATAEMPSWGVSRMVMTLLDEGLGLRVRFDQIAVVQSRLSREELNSVLDRASPGTFTRESAAVVHPLSLARADASREVLSRVTLVDTQVVAKMGGGLEVGVRIGGGGGSMDRRRLVAGGDEDLLRPLAEATLDAVGGLMQRCGREVALRLKDVRRFGRRANDGVVVLVEAMADGRKTLLSGAAFSANSFQRASVAAVLQATNALVASVVEFQDTEEEPAAGAVPPVRRDSAESSGSSKTPAADDYVSEVLSRLTRGVDRPPQ